jgi:hypothetical protein
MRGKLKDTNKKSFPQPQSFFKRKKHILIALFVYYYQQKKMVVVEYAKSSRSGCHTCHKFIEADTLRFGTTVSNEGYINVEWHHDKCFWDKRARNYFYRKNKKINTVLKVAQFSGMDKIGDPNVNKEVEDKILKANFRWGTDAALEKAGIKKPAGDDAVPETAPAEEKKGKKGKKRAVKDMEEEEDAGVNEAKEEAEKEDVKEEKAEKAPKKKARSTRR